MQRAGIGRRLVIFTMVILGAVIFLYPTAADWYSRLRHAETLASYQQVMSSMSDDEKQEGLDRAAAYNADIPPGGLRDPFAETAHSEERHHFLADQFHVLQTRESDVIGRVRFDQVGIDLPMYHGTDNEVISKGAGHLDGSSLPIGGPSTHAVLTAHSGLPHARLFTPLHDAALGDVFWVEALGERRWYKVENIVIVDEYDLSELIVVEGRDYVTLFTCTPIGVNSHRLLVRGERIEAPSEDGGAVHDHVLLGFPWWALCLIFIAVALSLVLFWPRGQAE